MKKKIGFMAHYDRNLFHFRLPIMKKLINDGYEVYAISPEGEFTALIEKQGVTTINYSLDRGSLNPYNEVKSIFGIYKILKQLDLDLLHTFGAKSNIYGTIAGKLAGIPRLLNLVEGLGSFYTSDSFTKIIVRKIIQSLYKITFSISNGCVFVNSDDPDFMIKKKIINPKKVFIIKSVGVDVNKFDLNLYSFDKINKLKKFYGVSDKLTILMIARIIRDKGILEYLDAAFVLKQKYNFIDFVLVGDEDQGNPSNLGGKLDASNIIHLGYTKNIVDLFAISDIVVLPSYREGLPVTLMEAASMKKPIVTTTAVGCRDVVEEGKNGFKVPVKNSKELADKIEILVKNQELREKFGLYSREKVVKEFALERVVAKYSNLYKSLI